MIDKERALREQPLLAGRGRRRLQRRRRQRVPRLDRSRHTRPARAGRHGRQPQLSRAPSPDGPRRSPRDSASSTRSSAPSSSTVPSTAPTLPIAATTASTSSTPVSRRSPPRAAPSIVDGSNADDRGDYRPGRQAARELGVRSPLDDVGSWQGRDSRAVAPAGLPTWDEPASACLSSRIPYHSDVTDEKLRMIERAEQALRQLGFRVCRVRHHDDLARVEIGVDGAAAGTRRRGRPRPSRVSCKRSATGSVTIDPKGYRTGSLNEGLLLTSRVTTRPSYRRRRDRPGLSRASPAVPPALPRRSRLDQLRARDSRLRRRASPAAPAWLPGVHGVAALLDAGVGSELRSLVRAERDQRCDRRVRDGGHGRRHGRQDDRGCGRHAACCEHTALLDDGLAAAERHAGPGRCARRRRRLLLLGPGRSRALPGLGVWPVWRPAYGRRSSGSRCRCWCWRSARQPAPGRWRRAAGDRGAYAVWCARLGPVPLVLVTRGTAGNTCGRSPARARRTSPAWSCCGPRRRRASSLAALTVDVPDSLAVSRRRPPPCFLLCGAGLVVLASGSTGPGLADADGAVRAVPRVPPAVSGNGNDEVRAASRRPGRLSRRRRAVGDPDSAPGISPRRPSARRVGGGADGAAPAREPGGAVRLRGGACAGLPAARRHDRRRGRPAIPAAPVLAMHRRAAFDFRRPLEWIAPSGPSLQGRLPSPPKREWLEAVKYWNGGGTAAGLVRGRSAPERSRAHRCTASPGVPLAGRGGAARGRRSTKRDGLVRHPAAGLVSRRRAGL